MAKNSSELQQRAAAKQAPVLSATVDEADDGGDRQLRTVHTIKPPGLAATAARPDVASFEPTTGDEVAAKAKLVSSAVAASDETPHVHEETEEAREARLDKQWKQLKVEVGDLPDVYAKLSKFKLTGDVCTATDRKPPTGSQRSCLLLHI